MRLIETILGSRLDPAFAERLHRLDHCGAVDRLAIESAAIERRRFKATSQHGVELALALPRDQTLFDGAVLALERDWALLVQVTRPRWLRFVPRDAAAAVELGYAAGNLHWRVRFDGATLRVAMEGPPSLYEARLKPLVANDRVRMEVEEEEGDDATFPETVDRSPR